VAASGGNHGCNYSFELKLRLFADRTDLFGGSRVEQEKDHVIAAYQDGANVCDMGAVAPQPRRALREMFGGTLHSLRLDIWPETLDQECGVRYWLDHQCNPNPAPTSE
jgi:hypothetical protein